MSLVGLILAGGASSRMGRDKAALVLDGVSLLDRARALLREAGAKTVAVSGRPDAEGAIPDRTALAGPHLAAWDALLILAEAGHRLALVVPVDMPLMTAAALDPLIAAASIGAAAYEDHPLPFCARLHIPTLEGPPPESLNDLIDRLSGIRLPIADGDEAKFSNVNTPEDWRRLTGS